LTKQLKKAIRKDLAAIETKIQRAEHQIPLIEKVRSLAKQITNQEIESELGEKELYDFLTNKDYPNAEKIATASLYGVANEYREWLDLKARVRALYKYQIKDDKVQISPIWKVDLENEHTSFIYDEDVIKYDAIEKLAKEVNKVIDLVGSNPLQMLHLRNASVLNYSINDRAFMFTIQQQRRA